VIAYIEPFSGASGDMILGALLDAGLSLPALTAALHTLPLPAWRLGTDQVRRGALGATAIQVIEEEHDPPHRSLADILRCIDGGELPPPAAAQARAVFNRLAEAEARVHRIALQEVHFHEVGALDAIVDICGAATGLALLGVDTLYSAPLPLNAGGTVVAAHGVLPLPAPASLELLAQAQAPTYPHPSTLELLTPTGAAILTTLARFERPGMRPHAVGYGAGSRSEPEPNVLRVTLGVRAAGSQEGQDELLVMLACNIDDMNPQWYGNLFELLLARGALDVTCTPALMKKGRPGQVLSVLCREADADGLTDLVLLETTTLGVRRYGVSRRAARRAFVTVDTPYGGVPVKLRVASGRVTQAVPEYEDCRTLARQAGVSLGAVTMAAQAAAFPLLGTKREREDTKP
jgi:uncharacterized protein (TIGR00299 family) protein